MPLFGQTTATPQATVQDRSGEILGQSLTSVGSALAQGIEKRRANVNERKYYGEKFRGALGLALDSGLINDQEYSDASNKADNASTSELRAGYENTVGRIGHLTANQQRQQQNKYAEANEMRAQNRERREQGTYEAQQQEADYNRPLKQRSLEASVEGQELDNRTKELAYQQTQQRLSGQGLDVPEGLEVASATRNADGRLTYTYKANGKELSDSQVDTWASLQKAESDIDRIEQFYADLPKGFGGPISGRVKGVADTLFGASPDTQEAENLVNSAVANIARGVFGEVGVLTDADVRRYRDLLPNSTDTPTARSKKINALREGLGKQTEILRETLKDSGRRVPEDTSQSGSTAPPATNEVAVSDEDLPTLESLRGPQGQPQGRGQGRGISAQNRQPLANPLTIQGLDYNSGSNIPSQLF